MAPDPDKALNALRRLAANKVCGSCPYEERMGFKDVCMKYKIFVCSDCKSAHQAFSHRCKSVTMSNWSMAEVDELRQENGGGNAVNRATIFARLPEGAKRPMKGCHPDDMKAFIQEAYNDMRWFDANGQAPTAAPEVQRTATMQPPTRTPSQPSAPPVVHAKSAPPPSGDAHPHTHPHPKPKPKPNPRRKRKPKPKASPSPNPSPNPSPGTGDLFGDFDAAPAASSNGWASFE